MTRNQTITLAAAGSAALLIGAFAFQYVGGLPPCKLCIWQRYPHVIAVLLGLLALRLQSALLVVLGAVAAFATAAVGLYHVGVEQVWWQGPTTCSSGPITGKSADELLDQILSAQLVRCDEIAWEMLGISMAGWNALVSLGLAILWLTALRRR
ncbi:disulfide bond formation protein B [Roseobacter sp. YSTF-M11]|uniref:Disulfide bond formation protein B n=1 Tax=Roseobacter insulae TaxID=2859783 RepID=A0A9X1K3K7_9RHOB|nr:disulfide bond formation protein B [Roseobacter insulae]MBW4708732.1 disulfide bond formation protein B [Roseobacter insulae]